jgi:pimeloyl-ACP methyl ester carboxylesterase
MDLTDLYQGPLDEFVERRTRLVRETRSADPAGAAAIGKLRKPPVAVWAIDQLAADRRHVLAELLAGGADASAVQQSIAAGSETRDTLLVASSRLRDAVDVAARAAEDVLDQAGHARSEETARRIRATLQAVATGNAADRLLLWGGTLDHEVVASGFGAVDGPDDDDAVLAALLAPLRRHSSRPQRHTPPARTPKDEDRVARGAAAREAKQRDAAAAHARELAESGAPGNGYVPVNGVDMYWESRGRGEPPLIVVHGGFGVTSMFGDVLDQLAERRRVIAIELQGHGHTRDIDRPFTYEAFGDDIAGVITALGLGQVDLLGYSLGGGASLRCAIQHPDLVRRLMLVSTPFRRDGWFLEIRAAFDQMGRAAFEQMRHSPMYQAWLEVAPDRDAFPALIDRVGALQRRPYDWTADVKRMRMPVLLVYADADSIPPAHAAEFFALLGGGLRDAGWDGASMSESRLAILPGLTHYNIFQAAQLVPLVTDFLA